MEKHGWKKIAGFVGMACILGVLAGCGDAADDRGNGLQDGGSAMDGGKETADGRGGTVDLMEAVAVDGIGMEAEGEAEMTEVLADFSVRLLKQCLKEGESTVVSPFSVASALAMTANGAQGETLAQMEEALGAGIGEWNGCLGGYMGRLQEGEGEQLNVANSVWLKDAEGFEVKQGFLQANGRYYQAGVYRAPFDEATVGDINRWVKEHTDGMAGDILDRIPEGAVMYLVNAVAFDAEWESVYWSNAVRQGVFTREDGTACEVDMMYSGEYQYLKDDRAQGFVKYYKGRKYAFAALLPEEGMGAAEYAKSLTGEKLLGILNNVQEVKVAAAIPKFESDDSMEMSEILGEMGMRDAFDAERADFAGIGSYRDRPLFIGRVMHKAHIAVDELGTKAGAVSAVEMVAEAAEEEIKEVYLDRPFVYMVIDCETNLPVFLGVETL